MEPDCASQPGGRWPSKWRSLSGAGQWRRQVGGAATLAKLEPHSSRERKYLI